MTIPVSESPYCGRISHRWLRAATSVMVEDAVALCRKRWQAPSRSEVRLAKTHAWEQKGR